MIVRTKDLIEQAALGRDISDIISELDDNIGPELMKDAKEVQTLCRLIAGRKQERIANILESLMKLEHLNPSKIEKILNALSK